MTVVPFPQRLYEAKEFRANSSFGEFIAAGTLCGHIDFVGPWGCSYPLSPNEALAVIVMLQRARADVLENSDPDGDPRLVSR